MNLSFGPANDVGVRDSKVRGQLSKQPVSVGAQDPRSLPPFKNGLGDAGTSSALAGGLGSSSSSLAWFPTALKTGRPISDTPTRSLAALPIEARSESVPVFRCRVVRIVAGSTPRLINSCAASRNGCADDEITTWEPSIQSSNRSWRFAVSCTIRIIVTHHRK